VIDRARRSGEKAASVRGGHRDQHGTAKTRAICAARSSQRTAAADDGGAPRAAGHTTVVAGARRSGGSKGPLHPARRGEVEQAADKNAPACEKPAAPEPQPADATAARDPRKT